MPLAYQPPGVSVSETVTPQISPILAANALVCLVGLSQGFQTRTDQFKLTGTGPIALPGLPAGATVSSIVFVKDAINPAIPTDSGYVVTTDYTVSLPNGTISRVGAGAIPDGGLINVTYTYVPADYFSPTRLYDLGAVETRYGTGLNAAGNAINSPVSYAASIAFENGADSVVIQPLFKRATPGNPTTAAQQPTSVEAAATSTWSDTLQPLRDIEDINVIVPIAGQSQANVTDAVMLNIFQAVQDHMSFMAAQQQYNVAIFGEDSSASITSATQATIQGHAATLRSRYGGTLAEALVLINTAKFMRALPGFGVAPLAVGGQFMAAALAGMLASRPVSSSLTRKVVSGFVATGDSRDLQQKNADADAGLLVIEQKGNNLLIRHAITLDPGGSSRKELSVVRAKHRMIESVRDTLDRRIIGSIIADATAPLVVQTTVIGVLEQLRQEKDLVAYSGVQARLMSLEPTRIQVRFSYRPAFPLNYIDVVFSLDLTTGSVTVNGSGTDVLGGT